VGVIIIGPVEVGPGARIGAGAVVINDVPAGAVAVGNPARLVGEPSESS
jgi:serine acetyltransferase